MIIFFCCQIYFYKITHCILSLSMLKLEKKFKINFFKKLFRCVDIKNNFFKKIYIILIHL
jgi:hypothetical protein